MRTTPSRTIDDGRLSRAHVIKIANAHAKFVLDCTGSKGVTVEGVVGYYLKASSVYEQVCAGGAGEGQ